MELISAHLACQFKEWVKQLARHVSGDQPNFRRVLHFHATFPTLPSPSLSPSPSPSTLPSPSLPPSYVFNPLLKLTRQMGRYQIDRFLWVTLLALSVTREIGEGKGRSRLRKALGLPHGYLNVSRICFELCVLSILHRYIPYAYM